MPPVHRRSDDSLLPADRDSTMPPPNGEDQFAIGSVGDVDNSHLSLYSAHVNNPSDWTQGATFTGDNNSQLIPIASLHSGLQRSITAALAFRRKASPTWLDSLGDRLMYRFAYWEDQPLANVLANAAEAGSVAALAGEPGT